ncbi:6-carboxyhexanoate--CoA ligase [Ectobacillus polymachus]|uniref:6-carboxyhexanoate--CoA ligase n=1 Tax=Ectobacillus polymachus TaxID=1508806 RepID=UPI003A8559AC
MALFSIRMRAANGGPHEEGGRHISGGERLVQERELKQYAQQLIDRALHHSRGEADFINITIDRIPASSIHYSSPLSVESIECKTVTEARQFAIKQLMEEGVSDKAARKGVEFITYDTKTRGAIIMDADSGERLDDRGTRGVRVSHLDWEEEDWKKWQKREGGSSRIREAIALATKVQLAGSVAELCWSDDPEYVTGYVGGKSYCRIPQLKRLGEDSGGRVFYVRQPIDLEQYIHFLELVPVMIRGDK